MIQQLIVLRESAQALSQALEESAVLEVLLDQVVPALSARGGLVRLLSSQGDTLLLAHAVGLSDAYLTKGPVRVAESQVDERTLEGRVVTIADVTQEPGFQYPAAAAREGLRGMLSLPLRVRDQTVGVLRVYVDDVQAISPEDTLMVGTLADLGALALERVRLDQSLYRISQAINAPSGLATMLQQVLEAAVEQMWLKAAAIRLLDPDTGRLQLAAAYGLSDMYLDKGDIYAEKSPVDRRVLMGESVVIYDVGREPGLQYPAEAIQEGIQSALAVPLQLRDRILGVMRVYSARPRRFDSVSITFLTSVADLVALAIENARLQAALQARYEELKTDVAEWYRFLALG